MNFVTLQHLVSGLTKQVPSGFSWTTLFFGCIPALLRGDIKWAAIMFLATWITFGISWLVFPFIYNNLYIKDLLNDGWINVLNPIIVTQAVPAQQVINVTVNQNTDSQ